MEFFSSDSKLNVDGTRVSFSGFRSGIDFRGTVDAIMDARRFPVDRMESKVEERTSQIAAYEAAQTRLTALKDAMSNLYGAVSVGDSRDGFEAKQSFATTRRTDGQSPANAANLLSVNVTNAANVADHELEILQVAKAQKLGSDTFADSEADLGLTGSFDVNGTTITLQSTDSLRDVRDRFETANSGATPSGVSASIVQASDTEFTLVLTADATGDPIELTDTDGALASLGIVDGTGAAKHELQAAQNAKLKADGLTVADALRSDRQASATDPLDTAGTTGTFTITDDATGEVYTIDYDETADSLTDIANRIDVATGGSGGDNLSAAVVEDNGEFRLQITRDGGGTLTFSDTSGTLGSDLGIAAATDVERVITRSDNTIDDLFEGVTLDLFQAELGTTVDLEVEPDLNGIKESLVDFVNAYNNVKQYINAQRLDIELEGMAEGEAGALRRDRTLADIETRLNGILANGSEGGTGFDVLAQIGIDFVDNGSADNRTLQDTLEIDETQLNDQLLNNLDKVRDLFAFDLTTTSTEISLINFSGQTQHNDAGDHQIYVEANASGAVTYAEINGVPATLSGNTIKAADGSGGAEGLSVFYNGGQTAGKTIDFNVSTGVASEMYFEVDRTLAANGPIDSQIDALTAQNTQAEERIDRQLERLDYQRERLLERFVEMERQLAEMDRIKESLSQLEKSLGGNQ